MAVAVVPVAPAAVALPQLDERVAHRPSALLQHAAVDDDPLPQRLAAVLDRQVGVGRPDAALAEQRPGQLGQRLGHRDQRLRRMPQGGRAVRGVVERRPRRGVVRVGRREDQPAHAVPSPT